MRVDKFVRLIEHCDQHHHRRMDNCRPCVLRLEQLLKLYRGEFLAGFSLDDSTLFEEWLLLKREWLHDRAINALTTLADYHERRGEYDQARRYAQQEVHLPANELRPHLETNLVQTLANSCAMIMPQNTLNLRLAGRIFPKCLMKLQSCIKTKF